MPADLKECLKRVDSAAYESCQKNRIAEIDGTAIAKAKIEVGPFQWFLFERGLLAVGQVSSSNRLKAKCKEIGGQIQQLNQPLSPDEQDLLNAVQVLPTMLKDPREFPQEWFQKKLEDLTQRWRVIEQERSKQVDSSDSNTDASTRSSSTSSAFSLASRPIDGWNIELVPLRVPS